MNAIFLVAPRIIYAQIVSSNLHVALYATRSFSHKSICQATAHQLCLATNGKSQSKCDNALQCSRQTMDPEFPRRRKRSREIQVEGKIVQIMDTFTDAGTQTHTRLNHVCVSVSSGPIQSDLGFCVRKKCGATLCHAPLGYNVDVSMANGINWKVAYEWNK